MSVLVDRPILTGELVSGPVAGAAVVVEHLGRRFGSRHVLRDVSFSVGEGRAFGIAGANGSGKTVLLRLLASLDRPSAGRASIHGMSTLRDARAVRRRVGYVPEEPLLYDGLPALAFLEFVGSSRGLGRQVQAATIDMLLEVVGLEEDRHREVGTFSPGERRRLALAAALMHEPDVLLLDDPLRSLDGQARLEQLEVLRELRRLGSTVVATATRPEDLLDLCDDLAVLRSGTLAWRGDQTAATVLAAPSESDGVRVRLELLAGAENAITLLSQRRDVRELEVDEDNRTIWFLFTGDRETLAGMVPQFIRAGCGIAHFGIEKRSASAAIAGLFRPTGDKD